MEISMEQHGISKLDLKRQNRMHVLKILKQRGPTSRIDIAGALELTRAAVTIITNEMIEQGIITELGEYKQVSEKPPRGRKKILIDINHNYKLTIGVTIEADNISVGMSTLSGAVLDKRNMPIDENFKCDEIISFIRKSVKEILGDNCIDHSQLLGMGLGVYPSMFEKLGIPCEGGVPDYSKLRSIFEEDMKLPVVIDNSVKGMAMANIDFEKVRDAERRNIAFLQYGESLHFVVTNLNDPIVSYDHRTDFVDKIIINPNAKDSAGGARLGCCCSEISSLALIRKVSAVFGPERTPYLYRLLGGDLSEISLANIAQSYKKQDGGTVSVVDGVLEMMAVLLNNLYYTTNPQRIVIQNLSNLDPLISENLVKAAEKISGSEVAGKISMSIIDEKHHFLAGCALAIRELFFDKGGFAVRSIR